jgi:hypothetical protein
VHTDLKDQTRLKTSESTVSTTQNVFCKIYLLNGEWMKSKIDKINESITSVEWNKIINKKPWTVYVLQGGRNID